MNRVLSEKEYQEFFLERLKENGYEVWPASHYDKTFAISRSELFRFLNSTQPEKMKLLNRIYKSETEDVIVNAINMEETKLRGSRLSVFKYGLDISNLHLDLMYTKPETKFNQTLNALYFKNIFSVSEEVNASDKERVDVVIFLNGLAIMTFELKANTAGQTVEDAIHQYQTDRNPKTRLFYPKAGALVHFAMDLEQVYMTTQLEKESTFFLPFNMGKGSGIYTGAGNPLFEDKYSVYYMWENILKKDSVLEIISRFMFIESKEKKTRTGKKKVIETVIFPRYHQLDVVRKVLEDVMENKTSQNYLLQHSTGAGKTNEISWLSYRLATLHDSDDNIIFDTVIICTDRKVVDRQLQQAVLGQDHKSGFVRVMDDRCTSADLAKTLLGNTKIIVTTIQKFPYVIKNISDLPDKRFAVIIDEAHSSTSGKNMASLNHVLSNEEGKEELDTEDAIINELAKTGKQQNVSMFAFTATPKPTTLQMFGQTNAKGQKEAFHIYSMKQAIEEGFILDVLQNYTTYKTYCTINKEIIEDPLYKTNEAKRQIAQFIDLHETNISQRLEVIIEHFRTFVMPELGGLAKSMIVTSSRAAAVKYKNAIDDYIRAKGYNDIHALVAFSGKVELDGVEYTEAGMNGISEKKLPDEFDKDEYNILVVADKYQTGFDQKKLCGMYILKKLHGIATVQTLNRLDRICPPYDKKIFVLDFENEYDDVIKDFSKYYTTTLLSNSVTPSSVYELEAKLDGFYVIDPLDIDSFNDLLCKGTSTPKEKHSMEYLLQKTKKTIETGRSQEEQHEIVLTINAFIRCYEFLIQVSCLEDVELHKKYKFVRCLQTYLKFNTYDIGFTISDKITATDFAQKKEKEYNKTKIHPNPIVRLPIAEQITIPSDKTEKLSRIIAEINSKTGKSYDNNVAVKAMLQIKDILIKSETLRSCAKNNTEKDFEFAYFDNIDDALIEGLNQNQDFFTLLLQNEDLKKEVLGIFSSEIYKALRA